MENSKKAKNGPDLRRNRLMPLQRTLLEEAEREISIVSEGRRQDTTVGNVVLRKMLQTAASGSPHALGHAMRAIIAAQQLQSVEVDEDINFARRYKHQQEEHLARAIKEGHNIEEVLPHPDDIVIIEGEGYQITGPGCREELVIIKRSCAYRDILLLQAVLEDRILPVSQQKSEAGLEEEDSGQSALVLAQFFNMGLPDRYRQSQLDMVCCLQRYERLDKRELLKQTRQAWRWLGYDRPRGWTMRRWREMRGEFEMLLNEAKGLASLFQAIKPVSEHQIEAHVRRLYNLLR
ncbi:hypothetical protein CQ054_20835 [Ochrobactrum sp. MYb29]|nr:hypothetical protein CQ054_20835 [Ochrobactrum sp. MYb29]